MSQEGESAVSSTEAEPVVHQYTAMQRGTHSLHECRDAEDFCRRFEAGTGFPVRDVVEQVVCHTAPKAIFSVGSLPMGMGTSGSDVDLIVLVDSKAALTVREDRIANNTQQLAFYIQDDALLGGSFLTLHGGILVELQVAITPTIQSIYRGLRRRGPELSEIEIRTLSRLNTGWLLWQSEGYLDKYAGILKDPTLDVYCATKRFVSALHERAKAIRAVGSQDMTLALQLGRLAVELVYLAYFASEGLAYLGSRWVTQIGRARGAAERIARYPLLTAGAQLLFPPYTSDSEETMRYLQAVSEFLTAMRALIEQKTLFRIAFHACPQIHPL